MSQTRASSACSAPSRPHQVRLRDVDSVRALLKAGVDVTFHTGEEPPLVIACKLQSCDLVHMLAAAAPPAPAMPNNVGGGGSVVNGPFRCDPPLHVVAQLGCVDVGECLLSNGADVNLLSSIAGDTPLLRAICHGRSDFIRLLHAHAAEWLKPGRGGIAPFVLASITQNTSAAECCLDAGITCPAPISSLDLLRVLLAFPSVDAVTAAACKRLLLLWEQGAAQRHLAESLLLQWFGLLLVSSADAGAPSPIFSVLTASLVAICRRSGRYCPTSPPRLCPCHLTSRVVFPHPQLLRSAAAPLQQCGVKLSIRLPQVPVRAAAAAA